MRITTGHAARPRLPPRGVDQALAQMRPHVLELDPANSSLLPRDRHAYGLHPATAGQASQQWRHEHLLIAPIIAPLRAPRRGAGPKRSDRWRTGRDLRRRNLLYAGP